MESEEDDEETQASFCRFLENNFRLPISAYAPGCVPKVEIKERLLNEVEIASVIVTAEKMNEYWQEQDDLWNEAVKSMGKVASV